MVELLETPGPRYWVVQIWNDVNEIYHPSAFREASPNRFVDHPPGGEVEVKYICPDCHGSGEVWYSEGYEKARDVCPRTVARKLTLPPADKWWLGKTSDFSPVQHANNKGHPISLPGNPYIAAVEVNP